MTVSLRRVATWVFVVPSLFNALRPPGLRSEIIAPGVAVPALILMTGLVALQVTRRPPAKAFVRVAIVAGTLVFLAGLYSMRWPKLADTVGGDYSSLAIGNSAFVGLAVAYGCIFFDRDILLRVFTRCARFGLIAALGFYVFNELAGTGWGTHTYYGTARLEGFMLEPSAWAPVLSALGLLSMRSGHRRWVALCAVGLLLTKSPTVVLVAVIVTPSYFLLTARHSGRRALVLGALAVAAPLFVYNLQQVDPTKPVSSGVYDQVLGRLSLGLANVQTGGDVGSNDRYQSTQDIIDELGDHGWTFTGLGMGGGGAYFQATSDTTRPNSLPVSVFADFGVFAVGFLLVLMARLVRRGRHDPDAFALFLPYTVASLVNSAGGWEDYKYVVVGIVVYGLRWGPQQPVVATARRPSLARRRRRLVVRSAF